MSKKVSLTQEIEKELNGDQEPPKRSKIHEYFLNKLTPEELAEHQRKVAEKRRATWAAKKEQQEQIKQQAMALVPSVLAHDIAQKELESENFIPTQDMIDKMKLLLKKDITIEELRKRYFRTVSDNTWHKIIKYVFKSQVMQIEDVGADILSAKRNAIELLRKRIKEYKKEIKAYKQTDKYKRDKIVPLGLLDRLHEAEDKYMEITLDSAKTLHQVGAVGESSKAPNFVINMKAPRPQKEEKVVVIENGNN